MQTVSLLKYHCVRAAVPSQAARRKITNHCLQQVWMRQGRAKVARQRCGLCLFGDREPLRVPGAGRCAGLRCGFHSPSWCRAVARKSFQSSQNLPLPFSLCLTKLLPREGLPRGLVSTHCLLSTHRLLPALALPHARSSVGT